MVIKTQNVHPAWERDEIILTDYSFYVRMVPIMIKKEQNFREVIYGRCC
jgi:hypothetical protein